MSLGAFFEVILAIGNISTAVTLFPMLKRPILVVGLITLLSIVTLRQDFEGAGGADSAVLIIAPASRQSRSMTERSCLGSACCRASGTGCWG